MQKGWEKREKEQERERGKGGEKRETASEANSCGLWTQADLAYNSDCTTNIYKMCYPKHLSQL